MSAPPPSKKVVDIHSEAEVPLTARQGRATLAGLATGEVCMFMSSSPSAEPAERGSGAPSRVVYTANTVNI